MAKYTSNRGSSDRKATRRNPDTEHHTMDDVIIDISTCSKLSRSGRPAGFRQSFTRARNQAQGQYISAIKPHQLAFGLGPAGSRPCDAGDRAGRDAGCANCTVATHAGAPGR